MKKLLIALLIILAPNLAFASNTASSSQRIQGNPTAVGDPVHIGCRYESSPSTIASGGHGDVLCDANGRVNIVANGSVAAGTTDSGNPIKIGCYVNTGVPPGIGYALIIAAGDNGGTAGNDTRTLLYGFPSRVGGSPSPNPTAMGPFVFNGTSWDRQRGDTNGTVVQPGLSSTFWYYTSGTSPILSNTTTAVTLKAAAGSGVRNYIDSCQISSTALGASVPLAIRDGASGTVIWAIRPPTAGWTMPAELHFSPPLRSTANTLLEIVTTTADTSGTFDVNCQGHTGS